MTWPDIQLERLIAALLWCSVGLAGMAWGRAQAAENRESEDLGWNSLAGASLSIALLVTLWLAVVQARLAAWPGWAEPVMGAMIAAGGAMVSGTAFRWRFGPMSGTVRLTSWWVTLSAMTVGALWPLAASGVAALGWGSAAAAAMSIATSDRAAISRRRAAVLAGGLVLIAVGLGGMPAPASLFVRTPSEQLLRLESREFLTLASVAAGLLVSCGALDLSGKRSRRRRRIEAGLIVLGALAIAEAGLETWRNSRERERAWLDLEAAARTLSVDVAALAAVPEDQTRPAYARVAEQLDALERGRPDGARYWLWTERDGIVTHLAHSAPADGTQAPRVPPGYRYLQLANFPPLAARADRFETGSFFEAGQRWVGLHVPVRGGDGRPVAWLQQKVLFSEWDRHLRAPLAVAVLIVLYGGGVVSVVLAGYSWLRAQQRLRERTLEAVTAARVKNEMAALLSHELRTPLQVVLGHLELLRDVPMTPPVTRAHAIIEQQSRQLLRLVNDTLDLCGLEADALALRPEAYSPALLATQLTDAFQPMAIARGLELRLALASGLPERGVTDVGRLRQVLSNLLVNALNYTPQGHVSLTVSAAGDTVSFRVSDTGPGLPPEVAARLGEPFRPGRGSRSTGLGLALARRLAIRLGGELTVQSQPGAGCQFTVRIPLGSMASVPELEAVTRPARPDPLTLAGRRVVLAEDNTLVRELITGHLQNQGLLVEAVPDGAAALMTCSERMPEIVILDLQMPAVDGCTVARRLRAMAPAGARLRIVALSADAMRAEEALAAGVDRFLAKPVRLDELTDALVDEREPRDRDPATPPELAVRLRAQFAQETPALLTQLRAAAGRQDWAEVRRLAHYLKNSADVLQASDLREACARLEQASDGQVDWVACIDRLETSARRHLGAIAVPSSAAPAIHGR